MLLCSVVREENSEGDAAKKKRKKKKDHVSELTGRPSREPPAALRLCWRKAEKKKRKHFYHDVQGLSVCLGLKIPPEAKRPRPKKLS